MRSWKTSLVKYFELEETGEAEQDTALSKEDAPADESVLADEDSPVDESALTKEDASLGEAAPTDDSTPLTDAGLTESDPPADETESAAIGDNVGCASAPEDTASYTASEQTEFSEKAEVEEPPEESIQDTE